MKQASPPINRHPGQPGFHSDTYSLDNAAIGTLMELFNQSGLSDEEETEFRFRIRSIAMLANQYRKTDANTHYNCVTSLLLKRHPKENKPELLPYDLINSELRILKSTYDRALRSLKRIQKQTRFITDDSFKILDELLIDLNEAHPLTIQGIKNVWKDKYLAAVRPNYKKILETIKNFINEPSHQDLSDLIKLLEPLNDVLEYVDKEPISLSKGRPLSWENIILEQLEKLFLRFNKDKQIKRTSKLVELTESQFYQKDDGIFHDIVKTFFTSMKMDNSDHAGLIRKYIKAK